MSKHFRCLPLFRLYLCVCKSVCDSMFIAQHLSVHVDLFEMHLSKSQTRKEDAIYIYIYIQYLPLAANCINITGCHIPFYRHVYKLHSCKCNVLLLTLVKLDKVNHSVHNYYVRSPDFNLIEIELSRHFLYSFCYQCYRTIRAFCDTILNKTGMKWIYVANFNARFKSNQYGFSFDIKAKHVISMVSYLKI